MVDPSAPEKHDPRVLAVKAGLLALWALVSFGTCYFARDLQFFVGPWPFGFWMAAQGAVLVFITIIVAYAILMRRLSPQDNLPPPPGNPDA